MLSKSWCEMFVLKLSSIPFFFFINANLLRIKGVKKSKIMKANFELNHVKYKIEK